MQKKAPRHDCAPGREWSIEEYPATVWAADDSMRGIPFHAPDELIAGIRKFIADT